MAYKRTFGEIDGYPEGWKPLSGSREEVRRAGLHAHAVAGISGTAAQGADAIVLNGGYPDDRDYGEVIIYTGHGGQDSNTKRQTADQTLKDKGNAGLVKSQLDDLPVRVIRGFAAGPHGPTEGYRYDGLYRVVRHWFKTRSDGFRVLQFFLVKIGSSFDAPYPEAHLSPIEELIETTSTDIASRTLTTVNKINRRALIVKDIKRLYNNFCQVCGETIALPNGVTSQAAHIRPIGLPHNGPDALENLLCLCPNDHVRFDNGALYLTDDLKVINALTGATQDLHVHPKHHISIECVQHHRRCWVKES